MGKRCGVCGRAELLLVDRAGAAQWALAALPLRCPPALAAAVWISCGLPKDTAEAAALKNAILQKHQKKRMTFQIACGVCFKADKRAINTEPGELISENLISAMQKFSGENPLQATNVTAEK